MVTRLAQPGRAHVKSGGPQFESEIEFRNKTLKNGKHY